MTQGPTAPPRGLPGLDPSWSRRVTAPDADGVPRSWHVLDTGPPLSPPAEAPGGTVLCVHGNPTWSYLWRRVLADAPPGWRVVAVDQLGMGWSERTGRPRRLAQRVDDLDRLTDALDLTGPVVVLAHDWGGPISLGWAQRHTERLAAVVLTNTGVDLPQGLPAPPAIRLARARPLLDLACRRTPTFVRAATALSRPPLPRPVRAAFAAPYATAERRGAVADFVADIPLEPEHVSHHALAGIRERLPGLSRVPVLLVWGARDPVFGDVYLDDLVDRLPHADVHRYADASHLVLEDRPDGVAVIWQWITDRRATAAAPSTLAASAPTAESLPIRVDTAEPGRTAIVELSGAGARISFGELGARVDGMARGLWARGVRPGQRVALLVPPGIDLTTVVYAVWRLGAVVVVADAGLGLRRLAGALRGAAPAHVVGGRRGLLLANAGRVPGRRVRLEPADVPGLSASGTGVVLPDADPDPDADGAVLFTSGATGPPKGVVYTRRRLGAQVALLRDTFDLHAGERFVAAFAPFALYGPALGLTSAVPDMDPMAPDTLTASALADAVAAVDATCLFASPAALRNVVATADRLSPEQGAALRRPRLVLSAGAPVPLELLRRVKELLPAAATHTPYGMTEVLPVATTDPTAEADADGPEVAHHDGGGVCVGPPVPGVEVAVAPLDGHGRSAEDLTGRPGVLGEITVRGPHVKERYDRLWGAQRASERPAGWHRTGDVGHVDERGRLWVQGRLAHVVSTADGPVPPYAVEHRVEALGEVSRAAVVGVGPPGTQQVVVVVVPRHAGSRQRVSRRLPVLTPSGLTEAVRDAAGVHVAAVLQRPWLPVDIRHAAKVDRGALAVWATRHLHGPRAARELGRRRGRAPSRRSR